MNVELKSEIKEKKLVLFIGAGVSRSLGLPSWEELINEMGEQLNFNPEVFKILGNNNYLALAQYYKLEKGSIGPLRSWMDTKWHRHIEDVKKSEIHKCIVNLDVPIIYTTNYDRLLEEAYREFKGEDSFVKISDVADLRKAKSGVTQIVKFHGDFDRDDSIVLAENDYYKRLSLEEPLDLKLRSDLLGKSVLYIGYGLADMNIRYMLYRLSELWNMSLRPSEKPKSYIFSNSINPLQEKILDQWGLTVLSNNIDDQSEALLDFLKSLKM